MARPSSDGAPLSQRGRTLFGRHSSGRRARLPALTIRQPFCRHPA